MTLPTKLTILRIVLTFAIMAALLIPGAAGRGLALGLFLIASLTDWLDGVLARRFRQVSPLGILLDPLADKILVIGLLLAFVQMRLVRPWMVLVIAMRELLITGVRMYAAGRQIMIAAAKEGKHKTFSQMFTIALILALLFCREIVTPAGAARFETTMRAAIGWSMWVTVALTVYSGASFFWRNRTVLGLFPDKP
ncbi:MAG: CDP-diacylglycerol--glycerol-3-phosphate 3-phosphatidyltransferase [Candidatus Omnitrophica bacterium]|nr:CDP-diacylglycerol--glycerol-3-phosphate 3-phosphatidyltransferase [Candidatus Omnitrophota bacterium]